MAICGGHLVVAAMIARMSSSLEGVVAREDIAGERDEVREKIAVYLHLYVFVVPISPGAIIAREVE